MTPGENMNRGKKKVEVMQKGYFKTELTNSSQSYITIALAWKSLGKYNY